MTSIEIINSIKVKNCSSFTLQTNENLEEPDLALDFYIKISFFLF